MAEELNELLTCPFCGEKPKEPVDGDTVSVYHGCHAVPPSWIKREDWNRRAISRDAELVEQRETISKLTTQLEEYKANAGKAMCIYCGTVCKKGEEVAAHIMECIKHPLGELRDALVKGIEQNTHLRRELSSTREQLRTAEKVLGDPVLLAHRFHEAYERLAPGYGYETRKDTRAFDLGSPNGRLMIAVCKEILSKPPLTGETGKP